MKNKFSIITLFLIFVASCNLGKLPNKDLSKNNIEFVELSFPKGINNKKILKLDSSKLDEFSQILKNRVEQFVKPNNCYTLYIKLKDGGAVQYLTDGLNFQGFDDSSDLPFSFSTQTNVLKTIFNLQNIDSCN